MAAPPLNPMRRPSLFFLVFLITAGCGLQFGFPLPAEAEPQKIYSVEVWRFPTKNAAETVHWLLGDLVPKKYWNTLRVELIGNKFSVRVGKTYDKLEADRLLEIVSQHYITAIIVKTVYDESRVVTWYKPLEPEAAPLLPPEPEADEPVVEETVPKEISAAAPAEISEGPVFLEAPLTTAPDPGLFETPDPDLPDPEQEVYTIQVGSFNNLRRAKKLYLDLEWLLSPAERAFLRIEQVKGYDTVRVGGFGSGAKAFALLEKIWQLDRKAYILRAGIRKQRIEQLYRTPPVPSGSGELEPRL